MSLYNALFGKNPASGVLLAILGLNESDVGRFRDAYVTEEDGQPVIAIYTRNGGGNRDHYDDEVEEGPGCRCTGCTITYVLPAMPGYVRDEDDDFDSTYATVYFRPPNDDWRDLLAGLVREGGPGDDFREFVDAMQNPPAEPATRPQKLAADLIASLTRTGGADAGA
jgi:hypothetical protein